MKITSHICRLLAIALLLFTAGLALAADVQEEKVRLKQVIGTIEVRAPEGKWRAGRVGMRLKTGWEIRTFVESSAELEYESGTVVRLGENSVITLASLVTNKKDKSSVSSIKVPTGQVWANVKKLTSTRSKFDFETPTAVASIRGTRLGIRVKNRRTEVDVYEGAVAVRNKESGQETQATSRQRAVVEEGKGGIEMENLATVTKDTDSAVVDPFTGDTLAAPPDTTQSDTTAAQPPVDTLQATDTTAVQDTSANLPDTVETPPPADTTAVRDTTRAEPADTIETRPADTTRRSPDTTGRRLEKPADTTPPSPSRESLKKTLEENASFSLDILAPQGNSVVTQTPVLVRGKAIPGAGVTVGGKEVSVGGDGYFSDFVELKPGQNAVAIAAWRGTVVKNSILNVTYSPPLVLTVNNVVDNMEVLAADLPIDVEVSEGAEYSVNGVKGASLVTLSRGRNPITIKAWDAWGGQTERTYLVTYKEATDFVLSIAAPQDNTTVTVPVIPVAGSTSPGARVTVNGTAVPVNGSGFFSSQFPIPAEPRDYALEIVARLDGDERSETRTVTFAPPRKPLELVVSSPSPNEVIERSTITVRGQVTEGATIRVNGLMANVTPNGLFTAAIPLKEANIGGFDVEITATRDDDEITKMIGVKVPIASKAINTNAPRLQVGGLTSQAVRIGQLAVQVFDQTPGDQITVTVDNRGMRESFTLEPGGRETIMLNEGKNNLLIKAKDFAGNEAQPVTGQIYYLPGPLEIDVIEPSETNISIDDLPPRPHNVSSRLEMKFRVEIRDNIGTVPETINYCRVSGNGTVVLADEGNYFYSGRVPVNRGRTVFTIEVQDRTGFIQQKRVNVWIGK